MANQSWRIAQELNHELDQGYALLLLRRLRTHERSFAEAEAQLLDARAIFKQKNKPLPLAQGRLHQSVETRKLSGYYLMRLKDVTSGRLEEDSQTSEVSEDFGSFYLVTVRNTRTNDVAQDVVRSGYFAPAFADLNRRPVVQIGDILEVTVKNHKGETISPTLSYTVTPESIRQAFMSLTLKNIEIPQKSQLLQNYPNPFNPETWIPYQIHKPAEVVIDIFDMTGQLVRKLELGHREAGYYIGRTRAAHWNGRNDTGEKVASGVYFYQIKADDFSDTRRMLIVK